MRKIFIILVMAFLIFGQQGGYPGINILNDLDNVNVSNPDTGEALIFDGSKWVADSVSGGDFSDSARVASYADSARVSVYADSSRVSVFSDSTSKIDTTYTPLQTYITNHGGSGYWTKSDSFLYPTAYDSVKVGIGTTTPQHELHVDGNIAVDTIFFSGGDTLFEVPETSDSVTYAIYSDTALYADTAQVLIMDTLDTPTYFTVQDWSNSIQSAGIIDGGTITDAGGGSVNVAGVKGIIKTTNSAIGANVFFDVADSNSMPMVEDSTNYIAVSYNAGNPIFVTTRTNIANGRTIFNVGKVFREGTSLDIITSGLNIYDVTKRYQQRQTESTGFEFVSGAVVGETGDRNITITAGVLYAGNNRITTPSINTATGDDFEYYYYNGTAWVENTATQIDSLRYNNTASGLATLNNNQYGVHWVYKGTNGTTFVVYGQASYTLSGAQAAQPPTVLPDHVSGFGVLRAKIIIAKNASDFTEIESVTDISFSSTTASNHNELSGLQGGTADEYYHLIAGTLDNDIAIWDSTNATWATTGFIDSVGYADSATAIDTTYAPFQAYVANNSGSGSSRWTAFSGTRVNDSTMYATGGLATIGERTPIRYRATAGTWRYGFVLWTNDSTADIYGAPMTTSDDDEFQYGTADMIRYLPIAINGYWADGVSTKLLQEDLLMKFGIILPYGEAYLVNVKTVVLTDDSGASQPRLNITYSGNAILTNNSNAGVEPLETVVVTRIGFNTTNYKITTENVELTTDANGSNNDSQNLSVHLMLIVP